MYGALILEAVIICYAYVMLIHVCKLTGAGWYYYIICDGWKIANERV